MRTSLSLSLLCILLFVLSSPLHAQLEWAQTFGSESVEEVHALTIDGEGNAYVTGTFSGTVDFDPSDETFLLTSDGSNTFVSKFNPSGDFLWAKALLSTSVNYPSDIAVNEDGRLFLTGSFSGTADFNPDNNLTLLVTSNGSVDAYMWVLDTDGNIQTVRSGGSSQVDNGQAVVCDNQGNAFFTGHFFDTALFNGPGLNGTAAVGSDGLRDFYVIKMDENFDFEWEIAVGGQNSQDRAAAISLDDQGNIVVAGTFTGTVPFNSNNDFWTFDSNGEEDVFLYKIAPDGAFIWTKTFGGELEDNCGGLVIDSQNNSYVTGFFQSEVDFDPNEGEEILFTGVFAAGKRTYVQKLSSDGDLVWAKMIDGSANNQAYDLAIDDQDAVYAVGQFSGMIDFDPNGGSQTADSEGGTIDGFLVSLDASGNWLFSGAFSGDAVERVKGVALAEPNEMRLVGDFNGTIDLDPSSATLNFTTMGQFDIFLSNLIACQSSFGEETVNACEEFEWIDGVTYTSSTTAPTFTIQGGNVLGCDSIVSLNLTITNVNTEVSEAQGVLSVDEPATAYQWLDCDANFAPISGADAQSYEPTENGNYAVEITNGTCSAISECTAVIVDYIAEEGITNFTVQPSFGDGRFSVAAPTSEPYAVSVYSVYGQLVFTENYGAESVAKCQFQGAPGRYIIQLQSKQGVYQADYVVVK